KGREHLGNEHYAADVRVVLASCVPALEERQGWCAQTLLDDGLSLGGHVTKNPVAEPARLAGQHVDAERAKVVPARQSFHGHLLSGGREKQGFPALPPATADQKGMSEPSEGASSPGSLGPAPLVFSWYCR